MCEELCSGKVTQIGSQFAAALSEMQSKISQPALRLIKEANKLVSDVKLNDTQLTINDLALINTEAAQGDRVVGSSIGCHVLTMALYKRFKEGFMTEMSAIATQACCEEFNGYQEPASLQF